jgi:hypothetical protein
MLQGFHEHCHNHIAPQTENIDDVPVLPEQKTEDLPKAHTPIPFDAQRGALEFAAHPLMKENNKLRIEREQKEEARALKKLFQSGNLENIENFLLDEKIEHKTMQKELQRVKSENLAELSSATFLIDKDWRILTALELFDKGTFKHSVRTYTIAREILENGPKKLKKEIEQEGVLLNQFYIACLFHDLGKFAIPKFILNSVVTDEVWTSIFMDELSTDEQDEIFLNRKPILYVPDEIRKDHTMLHKYFKEHDFRAVSYVPVCKAFSKPEQLETFKERGMDSNLPLMEIVKPHEKYSKMMLKKLGYGLEAILAGHHHNHDSTDEQELENPASISALQVFVELSADAIHTIDVLEAFSGGRTYISESSWTDKYHAVVHLAEIGKIKNKWVAASIINYRLKNSQEEQTSNETSELAEIKKFLAENLPEEEFSYFE